ncbi:outer membrane lipoprotein-sorting protein [Sphingomonas vulcanisoli]|uniref:Outer membrane lipoprotein-sorting protein n=1 Tax=Sphingomonas vulcanisoli TaxID=1658060 RepID=A0ABX0TPD6_9SPHN|nr:outer membrane lipoprotein-sorting protein [Sphingomonas vulcanisoli]
MAAPLSAQKIFPQGTSPQLGAVAAPNGPVIAAAQLAQVQAHLRAVTTMTANFSQTDTNDKTLTGTLTLKRPGRIRFQYAPGVPLLIVGDGKALTMIDYQVGQVSRWPVGNSPLAILLDPDKDVSRYVHAVLPRIGGQVRPDPNKILIAGRDPKHPEFGEIVLGFVRTPAAPAGVMLTGWSVTDAQGGQTTTLLSNQRFNVPVSDSSFTFRDPRPQTRR